MAGKSAGVKIGILALQGDVSLHAKALKTLGITAIPVKTPAQLNSLDGLVIPGGESTTLLRLCEPMGMLPAITAFAESGGAIFGSCAGAIMLASKVTGPSQKSLGLIDMTVQRNGYGRQIDSTETRGQAHAPLGVNKITMVFIRAPKITAHGNGVKTLASHGDKPTLVQQKKIIASTFHPELGEDNSVYKYWLGLITS